VAYACNPSYSGGIVRDQEDHGSKPAWQFVRPYLEKTHHKKRLMWLKVNALNSNSSTAKEKKLKECLSGK
jgi:hypothetical protein